MNWHLDTHSTILSRRNEYHRRIGRQQFVTPKRPIAGPVPPDVSARIERWAEHRDWCFKMRLWETGKLCALEIGAEFDRWYFSRKPS